MKKLYLLLSFGITAITVNSFAMINQFPQKRIPKQNSRSNSTQTNSQNKNLDLFNALDYFNKCNNITAYNNILNETLENCSKTTPWDSSHKEHSKNYIYQINQWDHILTYPYHHIKNASDDINNILNENLPFWIDQKIINRCKTNNNCIKECANKSLSLIKDHCNFLVQNHHQIIKLNNNPHNNSFYFLVNKLYKKRREQEIKEELNNQTHQFQRKLIINQQLIKSHLCNLEFEFWNQFNYELNKRKKTDSE